MRLMLLVNSAASSVTARRRVVIAAELSARHDCEVVETHRRGHAIRLCRDAARRGVDVVVVLGGDGTLNEAANGLVGTECALAALPGGSTNVFARTLGLSDDPVEATGAILTAIDDGRLRRVGLGSVNGRHFLFHTGIGWDAVIVRGVERHGTLKRYASHPLFIWSGLRTYFTGWDRTRPHFQVSFDDDSAPVDSYFTLVMNSDPYTFVGSRPFRVTDAATLERPLVAVSLTSMRTRAFLGIMAASLRSQGRLSDHAVIDERPDLDELTITADRPIPYQVDGDDMGDTPELRFRHHPAAMTLVDPRPAWD